jgi:hypothetical protein
MCSSSSSEQQQSATMRAFSEAWPEREFVQQAAAQAGIEKGAATRHGMTTSPGNEQPDQGSPPLEVITKLFVPTGDFAPAEYERIALSEAEVVSLLSKEK